MRPQDAEGENGDISVEHDVGRLLMYDRIRIMKRYSIDKRVSNCVLLTPHFDKEVPHFKVRELVEVGRTFT